MGNRLPDSKIIIKVPIFPKSKERGILKVFKNILVVYDATYFQVDQEKIIVIEK